MSTHVKYQKQIGKIIWAVDPTQDPKEVKSIIKELRLWRKFTGHNIQPVAVFSEMLVRKESRAARSGPKRLDSAVYGPLSTFLKKVKVDDFLPAETIFISGNSTRKKAYMLAKFAELEKVSFIFVNTRAQKSRFPLRMGSFAETLISRSKIPVITMNPETLPSSQISSILFPLDFTREAKNALLRLIPIAKAFEAKILLYHLVEDPSLFIPDYSVNYLGMPTDMGPLAEDVVKSREKDIKKWSKLLQKQNVQGEELVQLQKKYLGKEIADIAKMERSHLIVIVNRSGPFAQAILGGVAKDVMLQAKCPVLVFYRPQAVRAVARKAEAPKTSTKTQVSRIEELQ